MATPQPLPESVATKLRSGTLDTDQMADRITFWRARGCDMSEWETPKLIRIGRRRSVTQKGFRETTLEELRSGRLTIEQVVERIRFWSGLGLGAELAEWATGPVVSELFPEACFDLFGMTSRRVGVLTLPGESDGVSVRLDSERLIAAADGASAVLQVHSTSPWVLAAEVPERWLLVLY